MATAKQELLERIFAEQGITLAKTVRRYRKQGMSWQTIAHWVRDNSGHTLTAETLRTWYN